MRILHDPDPPATGGGGAPPADPPTPPTAADSAAGGKTPREVALEKRISTLEDTNNTLATQFKSFLKDSGGTGFWHESYSRNGGMEAIYDDIPMPIGFAAFAPLVPARGPMFGAASRSGSASPSHPPVLSESDLYPPDKTP